MILAAGAADYGFNALWQPWPLSQLLLSHAGNSASAVLGAWLVRRFISEQPTLASVRELVGLVLLAGVVGVLPTAVNGTFMLARMNEGVDLLDNFTAWYTSDLLGVVILAPTVLVWHGVATRATERWTSKQFVEFCALLTALSLITSAAFYFQWLRQTETLYVAFPFMIWTALRFGLRGTTVAILVTTLIAQSFAALGYGALGGSALTASVKGVEIMVSLGVFAVVALLPATVFTALKMAQGRETIRTRTMTLMATGAKLPEVLDSIVAGVETELPGAMCSILLMDATGRQLKLGASPSLPPTLRDAIDGLDIGPDASLCGRAAFTKQPVIVEDVLTDPRTGAWREVAKRSGVVSCWSQPFSDSAGRLLGTFAVYHRRSCRPTDAEVQLISSAGQVAAIATERRQLEEQFLRSQRMEGIGTLAGGIAHDLNNVLTPIVISAEILRDSVNDKQSHGLLDNIEKSARRGASLVRQVLTFARGVEGSRDAIDLGEVVKEIETIVANTFPKNITFSSECDADLPKVFGNRTQLEQVLLNLCVNARDAMPGGGPLEITARSCLVDESRAKRNAGVTPGDYVEVQVKDAGIGISADVIHRIFEPFFTTKQIGQGTGLGLSTALGIVRSHDGFVEVTSKPEKGSWFRVYLPALTRSPFPVPAANLALGDSRGRGELVLFVDDELAIRQTTERLLTQSGYRVILAPHGAEALSLVERYRAELAVVITDMMMPIMGGRELIANLRSTAPDLPVITVSGYDADAHVSGAERMHHLAKPYEAADLRGMLAKLLHQHRRPRQVLPSDIPTPSSLHRGRDNLESR